jgi:hypothetical protein
LASKKVTVGTAAEARAVVEQLDSNGADLIKVYENVPREAYFAIIDEARRRKIPVDGHYPRIIALKLSGGPVRLPPARMATAVPAPPPAQSDPPSIQRGEHLYHEHCAYCHGG